MKGSKINAIYWSKIRLNPKIAQEQSFQTKLKIGRCQVHNKHTLASITTKYKVGIYLLDSS